VRDTAAWNHYRMARSDEDGSGENATLAGFLRQLATPGGMEVGRLFSQARDIPLELRRLVPILVEAVAQDDAEPSEVRADRSLSARNLDGSTRSRLQGEAQAVLSALDNAASNMAMDADPPQDFDEVSFFADPFGNLWRLVDFMPMIDLIPEHLAGIASLPMNEQLYAWEYIRQAQRPSVLDAVLRSQFLVAVSLIQPALSGALLAVMSAGRENPLAPKERSVLDGKVRKLLLSNPEDWRKALRGRFDADVLDRVVDWDELARYWAKRNLFAHRGPLVDALFREMFPHGPPIGAPVEIAELDVLDAFDFAAGTRLSFLVAAADLVTPSFGEHFAATHGVFATQDLDAKRWWLAEGTARAALAFAQTSETRAIAQVNLWLARCGRLGLDAVRPEVEAWDGEAIGPTFGLARLVLLGEDEASVKKIVELLAAGVLSRDDLRTWPLFVWLRDGALLDRV
jgi:hypothetical protein